ncbi:hypothetical protein K5D68_22105 [Pseudomonas cichorii]|nr:hypothetical protein [Pseudomonas cichorii]MBX8587147.1 hypothetical protein [Pseudomonas cichorii]
MKGKPLSRWVYLFIFLLLLVIAMCAGLKYPTLLENAVNTFGFLGFWITLFGLTVTIFEVLRTGSVASQMARVAEMSHNRLKRQIESHETQACLEIINSALSDLHNKKAVSVIFITRIKQGYISFFSKDRTPKRYGENLDILNSYEHIAQSRINRANANPKYPANQSQNVKLDVADHPYKLTIDTLKRMQDDILTHTALKNEYIGDSV